MKTLTVQQMPHGFEVDVPSFGYWVKVGMAFMTGVAIASILVIPIWMVFQTVLGMSMLRMMLH